MTDAPTSSGTFHAAIDGMHCGNCIIAVERILRALPSVKGARASYPPGGAILTIEGEPDRAAFETALKAKGYTLSSLSEDVPTPSGRARGMIEVTAAFAILLGIAIALQHFQLLPRAFSVSDQMSYGLVFLIGLVPCRDGRTAGGVCRQI
jgi:copper chaperone CopZ